MFWGSVGKTAFPELYAVQKTRNTIAAPAAPAMTPAAKEIRQKSRVLLRFVFPEKAFSGERTFDAMIFLASSARSELSGRSGDSRRMKYASSNTRLPVFFRKTISCMKIICEFFIML